LIDRLIALEEQQTPHPPKVADADMNKIDNNAPKVPKLIKKPIASTSIKK